MKLLITGATGFVGSHLIDKLLSQHQITVFSRNVNKARQRFGDRVEYINNLEQRTHLNEFDGVINLAGEPIVAKRWSEQQKQKICQSRWDITQRIATLVKQSDSPPHSFISASAVGYYGGQNKQRLDESSIAKEEFSHHVCKHWEQLALDAQSDTTRVCITRIGIVLGEDGGALGKMAPPFKMGLGGPIGHGEQGMSWVHIDDLTDLIIYLLHNQDCHGVYNATAPNPVSNKDFSAALGKALQRPALLTTPAFMLKLVMGEMSELLTEGQYVYPAKALLDGFQFQYPFIQEALDNLYKRPRLSDR